METLSVCYLLLPQEYSCYLNQGTHHKQQIVIFGCRQQDGIHLFIGFGPKKLLGNQDVVHTFPQQIVYEPGRCVHFFHKQNPDGKDLTDSSGSHFVLAL